MKGNLMIVEAIPYKRFKDKIKTVKEYEKKGYRVSIFENRYVYVEKKLKEVI